MRVKGCAGLVDRGIEASVSRRFRARLGSNIGDNGKHHTTEQSGQYLQEVISACFQRESRRKARMPAFAGMTTGFRTPIYFDEVLLA
jgi:hypothetical protein